MTHKKNTRLALGMSLLSILLCVSMLVGTTFAWFTDSVTSNLNQIIAGNLDLEVYYGDPADKNSIADAEKLFDDVTLWEPAAVAWENLTVINLGTLALKYDLMVSFNDENNVNGYGLSDILEIGVVDGGVTADTREGAIAQVQQWNKLTDFSLNGILLDQDASKTYGLVIRWNPTDEDNNWNVNNGKNTSDGQPLHINLGVMAFATQMIKENDSFGNDYDENAPWTTYADYSWYNANDSVFTVNSAEELAGLAAIANGTAENIARDTFKGKTVNIGKDIDLNGRLWTPISQFNGVLNGQNHTVYNMKVVGNDSVGFIGRQAGASCTIKDITFENAYVEGFRFIGVVMGYVYGSHTLDNVDVVNSTAVARYNSQSKGIRVGGLIGFLPPDGNPQTMKNCDVTGCTISGYHNVGAMSGTNYQVVTTENCTASNNTLIYGSDQQGAFDFGAGSSGYVEYVPASGFTATNNTIKGVFLSEKGAQAAIDAGATVLELNPDANVTLKDLGNLNTIYANGATVSFNGTTIKKDLTVKGAVIPSEIKSHTVDLYFEDCAFTGAYGINYTYCDNATFINCTFDCAEKAIHFDRVNTSLKVVNCEFIRGRVQLGAPGNVSFTECTFGATESTSIWSEKGMRVYGPTEFKGCEFNNRVVLAGANGLAISFEDCTVNGGTEITASGQIISGGNVPTVTIK
ncbi:MAG: SipW-dependent-type signal peptide-containing protein [Clostridia bacterium]|nr:SipW-dependent-type signal peptide-containing protein [Clostridia bacterium]